MGEKLSELYEKFGQMSVYALVVPVACFAIICTGYWYICYAAKDADLTADAKKAIQKVFGYISTYITFVAVVLFILTSVTYVLSSESVHTPIEVSKAVMDVLLALCAGFISLIIYQYTRDWSGAYTLVSEGVPVGGQECCKLNKVGKLDTFRSGGVWMFAILGFMVLIFVVGKMAAPHLTGTDGNNAPISIAFLIVSEMLVFGLWLAVMGFSLKFSPTFSKCKEGEEYTPVLSV